MWTKAHRERQRTFERGWRYPTDMTDTEWEQVKSYPPQPAKRGRKVAIDLARGAERVRYLARAGVDWRMMPHGFPPWQAVDG